LPLHEEDRMTKIALLGAGGKMGVRLASNLMGSRFDVAPVEVAEAGRGRLKAATGLATKSRAAFRARARKASAPATNGAAINRSKTIPAKRSDSASMRLAVGLRPKSSRSKWRNFSRRETPP
jgi:hypothetical protein